jgi:hypothetical protein
LITCYGLADFPSCHWLPAVRRPGAAVARLPSPVVRSELFEPTWTG